MLSQIKLSLKLVASFVSVATVTLLVGASGWVAFNRLGGHIREMGSVRLPGAVRRKQQEG